MNEQELPPVICPPLLSEARGCLRNWKTMIAINLALGLMLWFGYCTDCSWASSIANWVFPPAVALIALVSLLLFLESGQCWDKRSRRLYTLACMPSLVGGGIAITAVLLMTPLALLCYLARETDTCLTTDDPEQRIQQVVSPDGSRIATFYFRQRIVTCDHDDSRHEDDMMFARVRHQWLPFVEREVYCNVYGSTGVDLNLIRFNYLEWKDNNTLRIHETVSGERELKVGIIGARLPKSFWCAAGFL